MSSSKDDRDNSCVTCQFEDYVLFKNIKIDKKFDLIPYITSSIEGSNNSIDDKIEYGKVKNNIGLSLNAELSKARQELEVIRQEYNERNMRVINIQRQIGNIKYYGIQKEKKTFIKINKEYCFC